MVFDALFDTLKPMGICPTRWTVRADAPSNILANYNYNVLMQVWEEAKGIARDTETIGRINGVSGFL